MTVSPWALFSMCLIGWIWCTFQIYVVHLVFHYKTVAGNVWWWLNLWQGLNIVENSPKPNDLSILEIVLETSVMLFRRREMGIEEGWMYAFGAQWGQVPHFGTPTLVHHQMFWCRVKGGNGGWCRRVSRSKFIRVRWKLWCISAK